MNLIVLSYRVRDMLFVVFIMFLDSQSLRREFKVRERIVDVELVYLTTKGSSFEYSLWFKDQPNAFLKEELISKIS